MTATYDMARAADEVNVDVLPPIGPADDDAEGEPTAQEREVRHDLVQGELAGETIYVPPIKQWRSSALHAMRQGDFQTWAEITLDDDDWDIWQRVDPSLQDIEDFFESVNKGLGTDPGNSRASRRSSRRTRMR